MTPDSRAGRDVENEAGCDVKDEDGSDVKDDTSSLGESSLVSSICQSITSFIKTMMGCNSASSQLPNAPTSSELDAWDTWQERAQEDLSKHIQTKISGATTAISTNFTPAGHVFSSPLISTRVKTDCNKECEDRGFPHITFEWNSLTLSSSDWNNATA
ncbi:hypothetical protein VP01_2551g3 [Puccinia sorghi]|uniref:Uncharacterized protein n=1 Tax=Puccinia sorghi TaxID=27349 RepID=A0A0L6V5U5_9BASI|nr:hypothetical protein VP01_2551g3 [Puccinia sorghi]